ncbi:hypothetical protein ACFSM5_07920 [Lacibacterium aquatile]|uniref:Uncharacterized protein n=1 Tax=Lacibacterium aquatile TaxID=1168082 RepID=A0ABW5DQN4_9PROT
MAKPVIEYNEIVERYDLALLRKPGDIVIKNGDIVLNRGDLVLNDEYYHEMVRLVWSWRACAPNLEVLFDAWRNERDAQYELKEASNRSLSVDFGAGRPFWNGFPPEVIRSYHAANDAIDANAAAAEAYSGAIMVLLSNLLLRFKEAIGVSAHIWDGQGKKFGGCSTGPIVIAGANNFRHYDEWARKRVPTSQQLKSMRVISAALQIPLAPDGAEHGLGKNICPDLLNVLSDGSFDLLALNILRYAHDVAVSQKAEVSHS